MADTPKTLWITSISPETIGGASFVPTALRYGDRLTIGSEAIRAGDASADFKLALGDIRPGQSPDTRATFRCSDGHCRSAYELTNDFLSAIFKSIETKLPKNSSDAIDARVIVAEPLKFQVKDRKPDWLNNYRRNIRRMLDRFGTVEFLPEPFAVYQYYKYGLRLPKLADQSKHFVLILDMGGSTFDVCVIETTAQGDVSLAGSHSKPLSASSAPYAGFYLDRKIALYLLKRNTPQNRKRDVERYFGQYERTLKGELDPTDLREEAQAFIANIRALQPKCEAKKIELSQAIADWSLDAERYDKVEIEVPRDPLSHSESIPVELISHQAFNEFEAIWNSKLRNVVKDVLTRASDRLNGNKIDVSLISGGSANIGWLTSLMMRDFESELAEAEPVNISSSFQDVVANGLAIECARRLFTQNQQSPEFVAVTYNPIRLLLAPDGDDFIKPRFKSVDDRVDMRGLRPGDLIPSASVLRHFFGEPLCWQVKLPKPPKNYLEYIFCRPFDRADGSADSLDNAYNMEERKLHTRKKEFDARMKVEVIVRQDGTVAPKFIYKEENERGGVGENSEIGRSFYIDMTADAADLQQAAYVGLDFGASNSAVCRLSNDQIRLVDGRNSSKAWNGISSVLTLIPYPAAAAVKKLVAQHEEERVYDAALEAYEACLAMLAYSLAADVIYENPRWGGLVNCRHRSLGPLKALLQTAEESSKRTGNCVREPKHAHGIELLDEAVEHFTDVKHHKASRVSPKWVDYLDRLVYAMKQALQGNYFGYCATSTKVPLQDRFKGTFVVAHDHPPFVDHYRYTSKVAIEPEVALMFDPRTGYARSLTPLLTWHRSSSSDHPVCYVLDRFDKYLYKACHASAKVKAESIYPGLEDAIDDLLENGRFAIGDVWIDVPKLSRISHGDET